MENYDPGYICNHSDHNGRYAYDQQPQIALWNLSALAQALSPLVPQKQAEEILETYGDIFSAHYVELMCNKLGINYVGLEDFALIRPLLEMMQTSNIDYTKLFRELGNFNSAGEGNNIKLRDLFVDRTAFDAWTALYRDRLHAEGCPDRERKIKMDRVNPKYILRNYLAQTAISKAEKERDFSEVDRLLKLLSTPFDEQPGMESYAAPSPEWAKHLEVSCSS